MQSFDTATFIGALLAFVIGTGVAKGSQAYVAYLIGERKPRSEGRMSLKPSRHLEILGIVLALFMALGAGAVPWGKPLNTDNKTMRFGRFGNFLIGITGPIALLVLGLLAIGVIRLFFDGSFLPLLTRTIYAFGYFSILLAAFNLIPLAPLDGYRIWIQGLLPVAWENKLYWLETYGPVLLLVLVLLLPGFFGVNLPFVFAAPIVSFFLSLFGMQLQTQV